MVAVAVAAMAARAPVVMTIVVAKAVPRAAPGAIPQALGEPFVKEQPAAREARRAHLRRGAARTGRSRQSTALVGASRHLANGALGRASAQLRAVVAERLGCPAARQSMRIPAGHTSTPRISRCSRLTAACRQGEQALVNSATDRREHTFLINTLYAEVARGIVRSVALRPRGRKRGARPTRSSARVGT